MDKELQIMLPMKISNWESIPYSEVSTARIPNVPTKATMMKPGQSWAGVRHPTDSCRFASARNASQNTVCMVSQEISFLFTPS